MQHVAHCIENLEDLGVNDFKPVEVDMSDCVTIVEVMKNNSNGHPIKDINRNFVNEQIKVITDREAYNRNCKLCKHRMKKEEDKQKKFEDNKQLLLGQMLTHVCPIIHSTMDTIPEYK